MTAARRALGPILFSPRLVFVAALFTWPLFLYVWSGGSGWDVDALRERLAVPEEVGRARRGGMGFASLVGVLTGLLAGLGAHEVRRMHASWGLPSVRSGLWYGQLVVAAIGATVTIGWVALWAPVGNALDSGLTGMVMFGLVASLPHIALLFGETFLPTLTSMVVIVGMAAAPGWLVVVADTIGVPGLAVLALGALWPVWWGTTPDGHRRIIAWEAPDEGARRSSAAAGGALPPRNTLDWILRVGESAPVSDRLRRLMPLPGLLGVALLTAGTCTYLLASGSRSGMLLLIALQGTVAGPRELPYPISRRERAHLQFVETGLTLLVVAGVAAVFVTVFQQLDLGAWRWFAEHREAGTPQSVTIAAALAWFPLAQSGQALAPIQKIDQGWAIRPFLFSLPVVVAVVLALATADWLWRASPGDALTAIGRCALLGVVLQGAHYLFLRAVFQRRDLVVRGTS